MTNNDETNVSTLASETPATESPETKPRRTRGLPAGTTLAMRKDGVRETIESVVIALVLAFLFRTFEAEAFVIPTGSMGPTLEGRHKDLDCPQCGYHFRVNAAEEFDDLAGRMRPDGQGIIHSITCPVCRYTNEEVDYTKDPSYNGDRLLVSKMAYQIGEPERWDVIVFKFPEQAEMNYIKRLIGLPGETVRIFQGDIYINSPEQDGFHIARKPADKARVMWQPVYDNDYAQQELLDAGWPSRWSDSNDDNAAGDGWTRSDDLKTFSVAAEGAERRLTYRHVVPSWKDWREVKAGTLPHPSDARPQLISDFCGYNAGNTSRLSSRPPAQVLGPHWVGDLAVEGTIDVSQVGSDGQVEFELIRGGRRHTCTINLNDGTVTLGVDGIADFAPRAASDVRGTGSHEVTVANIDEQLHVWIDGDLLEFDAATAYADSDGSAPVIPTQDDLAPVSVIARDATLSVTHLRVFRDVYYIAADANSGPLVDYMHDSTFRHGSDEQLIDFLASPDQWGKFDNLRRVEFPLGDDQFFVLGDNSPRSRDSRLWTEQHFVEREMLIGKAMVVYWPHSWNEVPGTDIPFPLFPNFSAMRVVR
ncbi:MAG: signal peptidase I [Pirellulales bacterium]